MNDSEYILWTDREGNLIKTRRDCLKRTDGVDEYVG